MHFPYNKNSKHRGRKLRKEMTSEERKLWYCFLAKHTSKFLRQKPIDNYISDFYCSKAKLVIELDGSQHYSEDGLEYDKYRTKVLNQYGLNVLRFTNSEIRNNFEAVCKEIDKTLSQFH